MAFKPVGDVLRGRRDEVISARLLNGYSGPQAGGAQKRFGSCGRSDKSMRFAHGENRQGAGISSR